MICRSRNELRQTECGNRGGQYLPHSIPMGSAGCGTAEPRRQNRLRQIEAQLHRLNLPRDSSSTLAAGKKHRYSSGI